MKEAMVATTKRALLAPLPEVPCVTRFELAARLHVSVRTVDRMIADGEIRVRRVRGKAVRFLKSDVEEYLEGKKQKPELGTTRPPTTTPRR
jgi:excisionase family DNA binding protein